MSEAKLRSCPLCRGPAFRFVEGDAPHTEMHGVACGVCSLQITRRHPALAAEAWNKREKKRTVIDATKGD